MRIWKPEPSLEAIAEMQRDTMSGHLGIVVTEIGDDYLVGTMPCGPQTRQVHGILHGGASVVLAETLGSIGATLCVDASRFVCFGQEINANHLRPVRSGLVTGTARPFHIGARSHVWGIELRDDAGRRTCISRITMAIVERGRGAGA